MTVIVRKVSDGVWIAIPKSVTRAMKLTESTRLTISGDSNQLVLRKRGGGVRRRLSDIVGDINPRAYKRRGRELGFC